MMEILKEDKTILEFIEKDLNTSRAPLSPRNIFWNDLKMDLPKTIVNVVSQKHTLVTL